MRNASTIRDTFYRWRFTCRLRALRAVYWLGEAA